MNWIMNLLKIITDNKPALEVIFSGVLALFTIILAFFTWLLYQESRKTRIQNSTPQISIIFYFMSHGVLAMKIKNTSGIDAKNIDITCLNTNKHEDGAYTYPYSKKLTRKFDYLAASQEYSFMIGRYDVLQKESLSFKISFTDMKETGIITHYAKIDMTELDRIVPDCDPQKEIAAHLRTICNQFEIKKMIEDYTKRTSA